MPWPRMVIANISSCSSSMHSCIPLSFYLSAYNLHYQTILLCKRPRCKTSHNGLGYLHHRTAKRRLSQADHGRGGVDTPPPATRLTAVACNLLEGTNMMVAAPGPRILDHHPAGTVILRTPLRPRQRRKDDVQSQEAKRS